ncbi:MAG: hypothetical protein AAB364_03400 [Patescibacteria group bacterium]
MTIKSDLWWLVLILLGLGLAWFVTGGPNNPEANSGVFLKPPAQLDNNNYVPTSNNVPTSQGTAGGNYGAYNNLNSSNIPAASQSVYAGQFTINTGNARYEFQPNREYITLNYRGPAPVDITGWYLMNGKADRVYDTGGGNLARLPSDAVLIPRVTKLFRANGNNAANSDLILSDNAQVVITTGGPPTSSPFPLNANFQTNLCSGYLDDLENVDFSPSLWSSCPQPRDWPGASNIDNACYQFVSYLRSCHTPKFERKVDSVDYVDNQVNKLSSSCQNFVQNNFTYNGCVATFASRPDFYQNEWRIFLNRSWELWANERETITLYDKNNKIVAQEKY